MYMTTEPVDMADKLCGVLSHFPEFWINLQKKFDEDKIKLQKG